MKFAIVEGERREAPRHPNRCPLLRSLLGVKRTWVAALHMSAFDPKRTLPVHCGKGFDAGFSPYQSTRLNRYDAVS
jgi:hypothetical protein